MEIYNTSTARANLFKLVEQTADSHEPIYIVGKKNKAVLISEDDFKAMQETLHLLAIPQMKESILKASKEPLDTFSEQINWDKLDGEK